MSFPDRCDICPRACLADRRTGSGFCGCGDKIILNRVSVHKWEEPCVSGRRGSAAFFFGGCSLGCVYCQNSAISRSPVGKEFSVQEFSDLLLKAAGSGCETINLVTPTHFTPQVCEALSMVRGRISVPVVWNSGGYELTETLKLTEGLVDVYMPDFKYSDGELAGRLSNAPDYPEIAREAIGFMLSLRPKAEYGEDGILRRGVIVRHLCLPGYRENSLRVLRELDALRVRGEPLLSLMAQYTPDFYSGDDKNLRRRITTFEYKKIADEAASLGFEGFTQDVTSARATYTPPFGEEFADETDDKRNKK